MARAAHPSTPSLKMQIAILFSRFIITCRECKCRIVSPKDAEWDHGVEWADGGEHSIDNLAPIHNRKSGGCHVRKSARSETQRSRMDRIESIRLNKPIASLPHNIDPGEKCRSCGQYQDACVCTRTPKRKSLLTGGGFPKQHQPFRRDYTPREKDVRE